MTEKSPTCILNSACLHDPSTGHPTHRPLVTISSEVDSPVSSTSAFVSGVLPRGGSAAAFYGDQQQQQLRPNPGGVPLLGNNQYSCCPINTLSSSATNSDVGFLGVDFLQISANQKSLNRSKNSGWKTSKFFSKSMTSGEILKGLKKLSLTSSNDEQDAPTSSSSSKSLKSKLTNFKKRSSCGNEEVSLDVEALDKLSSSAPAATTVTSKSPVDKTLQDDGIVCKKEDLKAIICSATKRFPLCSPSRKKNALRQTKSASFEPPPERKKKEPVRRAGSEESRVRKISQSSVDNKEPPPSPKVSDAKAPSIANNKVPVVVVAASSPPPPVIVTEVLNTESPEVHVKEDDATCVSTVKWDETNVVDAVLIGDAIETFLKGSMGTAEKKVAFRKNSYEKKS